MTTPRSRGGSDAHLLRVTQKGEGCGVERVGHGVESPPHLAHV